MIQTTICDFHCQVIHPADISSLTEIAGQKIEYSIQQNPLVHEMVKHDNRQCHIWWGANQYQDWLLNSTFQQWRAKKTINPIIFANGIPNHFIAYLGKKFKLIGSANSYSHCNIRNLIADLNQNQNSLTFAFYLLKVNQQYLLNYFLFSFQQNRKIHYLLHNYPNPFKKTQFLIDHSLYIGDNQSDKIDLKQQVINKGFSADQFKDLLKDKKSIRLTFQQNNYWESILIQ
ncbi:MAG: hypothetical protein MJB14_14635 [Spirochaetes bacterium]|nr:hypothetical protein [Spirochaetota bacterium]